MNAARPLPLPFRPTETRMAELEARARRARELDRRDGLEKIDEPAPDEVRDAGARITDQVELLKSDNVVSEQARREQRTLEGLGIAPSGIEGIVPGYLYRFRKAGQFTAPKGIPE